MTHEDIPPDGVSPEEALTQYFSDRGAVAEYLRLKESGYVGLMWTIFGPETESNRKNRRYLKLRGCMEAELTQRLEEGDLVAHGYDSRVPFDAPLVPIPAHRWRTLKLDFRKSEATDGDLRISGLLIAPAKPAPVQPPTACGEQQCREWLAHQMCTGQRPKPKEHLREEAVTRFAVSLRGFKRAWKQAIEETGRHDWSRPGRKS